MQKPRSLRFCLHYSSVTFLLLAGCLVETPESPASPAPSSLPVDALQVQCDGQPSGILDYCLPGEPNSFNYLAANDTRTQLLTYLTTGTLLEFDAVRQRVVAGVARDWEISEDGRAVLLTLRKGVHFSDGLPVTSADVVFTFQKVFEADSQTLLKNALQVGGEVPQVAAVGEGQVSIQLKEPYAATEYILTTVPVLPSHLLDEPDRKIEEFWNLETPPEQMAGLGPFVLEDHRPGERTVLRRNPEYWKVDRKGRRLPYLDRLVIHYVADRNSQLLRFQSGDLDLLDYQLRPEDFLQLQETNGSAQLLNVGPSSHLSFFWFNLSSGERAKGEPFVAAEKQRWFDDVTFRRAVSAAISREAIVRNVFLGQATPTWTLMPASVPEWYLEKKPEPAYDPQYSKSLLRRAGFDWRTVDTSDILVDKWGKDVDFSLVTRSDDVWRRIAALIQSDLGQIGIRITLIQEDFRAVISRITRSRDYDSALLALNFPYEPADQVGTLLSSSKGHFWNPEQATAATDWERRIDDLMLRQVSTMDRKIRRDLYFKVQEILMDNVAIIPLVNRDVLVAAGPTLRNLRPASLHPNALWNVWELWIEGN